MWHFGEPFSSSPPPHRVSLIIWMALILYNIDCSVPMQTIEKWYVLKNFGFILWHTFQLFNKYLLTLLSRAGVGNSFWLAGHICNKIGRCGQYKYNKDLINMTFEKKYAFSSPFSQKKRL